MTTEPQTIVFRTDASVPIGTGHVMRCLTLACALREQGHACHFICREHPGNLIGTIRQRGFPVQALPMSGDGAAVTSAEGPTHTQWLGAPWETDARASREIIRELAPAWLVVDHYALDARWESVVTPEGSRLLVIDDLADRPHQADLLLDQNLGRQASDYADLVPAGCRLLIGPRHALLRPEFARLREDSRRRRRSPRLKRLLVSMGGMDPDNVTGKVLDALRTAPLPADLRIDVVMGGNAPWLRQVRDQAAAMPRPTRVMVDIPDMAQRMVEADLAIGAAGSTSWERCCLGLPALILVLAQNQREVAEFLARHGAVMFLQLGEGLSASLAEQVDLIVRRSELLTIMSSRAARLVDGRGCERVLRHVMD